MVVVDDGRCGSYDQSCLPGASKAHGERFAMEDHSIHWFDTLQLPLIPSPSIVIVTCLWRREGVAIPSYFMLLEHAEALWSATYVQEEEEERDEL